MMAWESFYVGIITQASLIVAIGAQNNFVLCQGLKRQHVGLVVNFCIVSDIILAACAVFGVTSVISNAPVFIIVLKIMGAGFLLTYGLLSFRSALKTQTLSFSSTNSSSVLFSLIGFTWLNPHVWMDTILLLGAVAQTQPVTTRIYFMMGICIVSIVWFYGLGNGARFLRPLFTKPETWKFLNILTGTLMIYLSITLLLSP